MKKKTPTRRSVKRRRRARPRSQPRRRYHLRNWKEYNAALVQRGSLTLWLDEAALAGWFNQSRSGQRGAPRIYSDLAIETALLLRAVYHQTLRSAQGLLGSVLELLGRTDLPVPDYSTVARRQRTLEVQLRRQRQRLEAALERGEAVHLVVDSTGCKIFGEGEWKVRLHGASKRRTWRKLHLGVNEASGEVLAAVLSTNDVADSQVLPQLVEQVEEPIEQFSGDGGYDTRGSYETLREREQQQREREQGEVLRVTIPPQQNARIWRHGNSRGERLARDQNLRRIREVGRKQWKEESGYHRRSLAETTMFRLKTIFGGALSARSFGAQATEAFIRCAALNRMTQCGMPDSYAV